MIKRTFGYNFHTYLFNSPQKLNNNCLGAQFYAFKLVASKFANYFFLADMLTLLVQLYLTCIFIF